MRDELGECLMGACRRREELFGVRDPIFEGVGMEWASFLRIIDRVGVETVGDADHGKDLCM